MLQSASFVFVTCQVGAEPALKMEVARELPMLRFAYSRPGFLTFKIAPGGKMPDDFAWKLVGELPVTRLHVWPRDRHPPGFRDYEPGMTPEAADAERVLRERAPAEV